MINWLLFVNLWQDRVSLLVLRDRRHGDNHMVARKQAQKREGGKGGSAFLPRAHFNYLIFFQRCPTSTIDW